LLHLYEFCHQVNMLTPRAGDKFGATLIIPPKSEIARLVSDSNSTDVAKVGNVCASLQSLLIRRAIASSSDWMASDVLDMQHPSHKLAVKVSGKSVSIVDGSKEIALTIDPDFKPAFRNLAIWIMADNGTVNPKRGEIVAQAPRSMRLKKDVKAAARERTGGYEATARHGETARFRVAIAVENEYLTMMARPTAPAGAPSRASNPSPFLTYMISFAHFVYDHDQSLFFQAVLPLIGFRVIDFYSLFESHRICEDRARYLVPDNVIEEWMATFAYRITKSEDVIAFRKWIDERIAEAASKCPCALYAQTSDLIGEIDGLRADALSAIQNVAQAAETIVAQYSKTLGDNAIGSIANAYPERIAQYWKARPCAKLAHDELAFVTEPIFCRLAHAFDINLYRSVISMIGVIMHAESDREICDKLPLTNARKLALFANDAIMSELRAFVNSTAYMWIPVTSAIVHDYPVTDSPNRGGADTGALYNVDLALALHHERLLGPEADRIARENKDAAIAAIRSLRQENISPEMRAHLQTLISQ
jgi:hypothetical protein